MSLSINSCCNSYPHLDSLYISFYFFRFILRNYIAQNAISAAERGDFSEVWKNYEKGVST